MERKFLVNDGAFVFSVRSKGKFKVNDIAKSLSGGGHAFAAGAVVQGSLNDVKDKAISTSINFLQQKMS